MKSCLMLYIMIIVLHHEPPPSPTRYCLPVKKYFHRYIDISMCDRHIAKELLKRDK